MRLLAPLLCLTALLVSGCGNDEQVLVIAYANEAPYGYTDTETGEVTGEAPEIARVVAEQLGYQDVQAHMVDFGALIPGLKSRRFDVVAAGMYITPERAANVLFSNPTNRIDEAFLVADGNPKNLHSYEDVAANDDSTIGVVSGTVERGYARDAGIPDERVVIFNDNASASTGVRSGQIDAFAGTSLTIRNLLERLGDDAGVERADPFAQPTYPDGTPKYGYGAFAFREDNQELRDRFNEVLDDFIGSPEHLALVEPFGFTENELPGGLTVEDVLEQQTASGENEDSDSDQANQE